MQPKTVELEGAKRPCRSCGLNTCRQVRQDYYVSLFFIPVVPVRRGDPFWQCARCGQGCQGQGAGLVRPLAEDPKPPAQSTAPAGAEPGPCRFCGKPLDADFRYCPYCGARV